MAKSGGLNGNSIFSLKKSKKKGEEIHTKIFIVSNLKVIRKVRLWNLQRMISYLRVALEKKKKVVNKSRSI